MEDFTAKSLTFLKSGIRHEKGLIGAGKVAQLELGFGGLKQLTATGDFPNLLGHLNLKREKEEQLTQVSSVLAKLVKLNPLNGELMRRRDPMKKEINCTGQD